MNRTHIDKGFSQNNVREQRDQGNRSGVAELRHSNMFEAAQGNCKVIEGRRDSHGAGSLPSCRNFK